MHAPLEPAALGLVAAALVVASWSSVAPPAAPLEGRVNAGSTSDPAGTAVWPVTPTTVLAGFDDPTTYAAGHRGVDLSADPGQPVRSAMAGTVTVAGPVAGRSLVVVDHGDGYRTTYLPVRPFVEVGQRVHRGTTIGHLLAGPHCGTLSCLHWGARRGSNDYVDPLSLLGRGPVVLLPTLDQSP